MLLEISIQNFAIIEEVRLLFDRGMTVLTGETGAGKSIIIDAMNLMLGARASSEVIRYGSDKASLEGLFSIDPKGAIHQVLEENGLSQSEDLIIRREIFANGRSVCRVNGQLVNVSVLREIGRFLVDIHGQHDQEELMRSQHHLSLLDSFGDEAFQVLKESYGETFEAYRTLRRQVLEQQANEKEHQARIEMLEYQMAELETANLQDGEEAALKQELDKLLHHKQIADTLTTAYQLLDEEEHSSLQQVRIAMNELQSVEEFDPDYREISGAVTEAYYLLEDSAKRLEDIVEDLDFDSNRLLQIESRLDTIHAITRKYGGSEKDVLLYQENSLKEYQLLTGKTADGKDLEVELKQLQETLLQKVEEMNQARHALAAQLEADIQQELQDLYMEKARFSVRFTPGKFSRTGNESVEFYIATNPGEELKPLVKVASGGEISRLMLAIKSAFARRDEKTSIVFDEVDTGVSGRVAQAIAQKIYRLGQHGQVLVISHLPQAIAIADHQYYIEKISDDASTVSKVRLLNDEERVEEIAKMLAGDHVTQAARHQARELLRKPEGNE